MASRLITAEIRVTYIVPAGVEASKVLWEATDAVEEAIKAHDGAIFARIGYGIPRGCDLPVRLVDGTWEVDE